MTYSLQSFADALGLDGPGSPEKPIQVYMLSNVCYINFAQNSSPGGVLALGLLLAVYGPGLGPDGPGCPEKP